MTNERARNDRLERLLEIVDAEICDASPGDLRQASLATQSAADHGAEEIRALIKAALDEHRNGLFPWLGQADRGDAWGGRD